MAKIQRHPFGECIKAVGTGPKHNHDLSREQIFFAMRQMLLREVSAEEIGAFLLGWRVKGESIEELEGALEAFDTLIESVEVENAIELGYPYDGKVDNPYLFPLSAEYLLSFDIKPVILGDILVPAKGGITVKEVCEHCHLPQNLLYFDRKTIFPTLSALSELRNRLTMRTSFNTIEKLIGFTNAEVGIVGAFHKPFVEKYISLYQNRYKTLVVVKGNEGTPEIFSKCRIWLCREGNVKEMMIDPSHVGIVYEKSWERISKERSFALLQEPDSALSALAKFNAALWLFAQNSAYASVYEAYEAL